MRSALSEQTNRVLELLRDSLVKSQRGWLAQCPAHEDSTASLSIREGRDGRCLVYCFAGCSVEDVVRSLGMSMGDLFPEGLATSPSRSSYRPPPRPRSVPKPKPLEPPTLVETYQYEDEDGAVLYEVLRYTPKTFKQRKNVGGEWVWGLDGVRRVIYRWPEVLEAVKLGKPIFVVEGEKDVNRLRSVGLVATCNSGGAMSWPEDPYLNSTFFGARVFIIPDNDKVIDGKIPVGEKHAADVKTKLEPHAGEVVTLRLPPEYKDVSEFLDAGGEIRAI